MTTRIDQLLHGYQRGHQQLAGSLRLPPKDAELVARLSDLSGTPTGPEVFSPYLTAYPLPSGSHFAVARTWPDPLASRSGCVLTHTVLLPMDRWQTAREPETISLLLRRPEDRSADGEYAAPLQWVDLERVPTPRLAEVSNGSSARFVDLYFAKGKKPVVWFGHSNPEGMFWTVAKALWPALRARFAACTHCLQPRTLDDRPFDLMFADTSAVPRFLRIDRTNTIESGSHGGATSTEEWSRRWTARMFGTGEGDDLLDEDLFAELDDDPTAIRRLYLIDTSLRAKSVPPPSAVGAMDLVESVARQPRTAIQTKEAIARRAILVARAASSATDSVECLRLIDERLKRTAYSHVAAELKPLIIQAVADRTTKNPELMVSTPLGLSDNGDNDEESPFARGVFEGFRSLLRSRSDRVVELRTIPRIAARLFADDPSYIEVFILALVARRGESAIRTTIREYLQLESAISRTLRTSVFAEFENADQDLIGDLCTNLREEEVSGALNAVVPFLSVESLRQVVDNRIVRNYPASVRNWALNRAAWTSEVASITADTFQRSFAGLSEVLSFQSSSDHRGALLAHFLSSLAGGGFPLWVRQSTADDLRLLATLLYADTRLASNVDAVVMQLLTECDELRLAHAPSLASEVGRFKNCVYYAKLSDHLYKNVVKGYLDGTLPEKLCVPLFCSGDMEEWFLNSAQQTLASLCTYQVWNRRDNWLNSWRLLCLLPTSVLAKLPSLVGSVVDILIRTYYPAWSVPVARTWVEILKKNRVERTDWQVSLHQDVQAFKYSVDNTRFPLSEVVVATFVSIYNAVTQSRSIPLETSALFGVFDWDKGKQLRKTLIETYMSSGWPPGDLVLACSEPSIFRKIFKRVHRRSGGPRFLHAALADLRGRENVDAEKWANLLDGLLRDPNFYEDWD